MPFANTPRGNFFCRHAVGRLPALLFLHGNLGTSLWWRPTLDLLPRGWLGLAPDAIGYGHSDRTSRFDRFSISAQVQDVDALVEALPPSKVHLVAHSTATPVAIEYALTYPGRVTSLVLVGTIPQAGVTTPPEAYPLLEQMGGNRELLAQALHASMPTLPPDSAAFESCLDEAAETTPIAFVATARALDGWRPGERLRQLTLPVLVMRGDRDIMLSEGEAHETLLAIPGANNLEVFKGLGHSPMVEHPKAFADALVRFIAEDWETYSEIRRLE